MASTIFVSKSGSDANNGSTYLLSKLTIQAGITAAGSGGTVIVGSGLYNEKLTVTNTLTINYDGVVILDGTSISSNPALLFTTNTATLNMSPYISGGQFIIQNHIGTNLIYESGTLTLTLNLTNVIFISNSNTNAINTAYYWPSITLINCVFSGFTTAITGQNTSPNIINVINCTFYSGTTGIITVNAANLSINNCIFSNITTAWNAASASVVIANNNLYYTITNWKVGASTYTSQATLQAAGYDSVSLWQNPNFIDPTNNIFYLTSNPNVTSNNYLYYGAFPYCSITRGNFYNPDSKWNIIAGAGYDNSGWYNPDGNVTLVSGMFQLTSGTSGAIWSPVYDLGASRTISQFNIEAIQSWPTNMVDKTTSDVRPNYQTAEIRASATTFNQNDGVIAWVELRNKVNFVTQGSTLITGRYCQLRLTLTNIDVGA